MAVDVYRNDLFVNRLSIADHNDNSLAKENEHTEIDYIPSNISLYNSSQIHNTSNIKEYLLCRDHLITTKNTL
ncbi:9557_t:CDS:2 [Funneliformis mosseae]|uniref:9557_t:CDS:1 n=1 Tax=Funneliformis mosseae TaxID=27381 RepID=A0A9N9FQ18_FUNMO|nr:9557_t:CDS:2 [Funneliformis mosseae]